MHPRADAHPISPIGAGVTAQPRTSRAVTTFAGNAFIRVRRWRETRLRDRLERGMTNRAARTVLRCGDANVFRDSRRARIQQNGIRPRVKILARPGDVLAAFFARATVTTGGSTTNRADKLRAVAARLLDFLSRNVRANCNEQETAQARVGHAARLSSAGVH